MQLGTHNSTQVIFVTCVITHWAAAVATVGGADFAFSVAPLFAYGNPIRSNRLVPRRISSAPGADRPRVRFEREPPRGLRSEGPGGIRRDTSGELLSAAFDLDPNLDGVEYPVGVTRGNVRNIPVDHRSGRKIGS